MKKIIAMLIVLIVGITCIYLLPSSAEQQQADKTVNTLDSPDDGSKVIAYYFHGNFRCSSCLTIEKYARESLEQYFNDELNSGKLIFQEVNVEEKGNEHFVIKYQLYTKSVILSLVKDGKEVRYKNLDKVWQLLRNRDNFYEYIKVETENFLNAETGEGI